MRDRSTETTVQTTTEKGILNTHKHKHKHKQPSIGKSKETDATSIGKLDSIVRMGQLEHPQISVE